MARSTFSPTKFLLGSALLFGGLYFMNQNRIEAMETYQITKPHKPVMNKMMRTMVLRRKSFKKGSSVAEACACMAKLAVAEHSPAELVVYQDVFVDIMNNVKKSSIRDQSKRHAELADRIRKMGKTHRLTVDQVLDVYLSTAAGITNCGNKSLQTPERIAEIAALTIKGGALNAAKSPSRAKPKPSIPAPPSLKPKPNTAEVVGMVHHKKEKTPTKKAEQHRPKAAPVLRGRSTAI